MRLFVLFLLLSVCAFSQDPKIAKYNREIDSLKGVYGIPTAMGYTKTVIRDEDGIRETMILFYRKGGETEEVILWTKQLGSKDSIIILGQLTVNDITVPKDTVIVKPKGDSLFTGTTPIIILGQLTDSIIDLPKGTVMPKPKLDCDFYHTGSAIYSDNRLFGVLFDSRCRKRKYFLLKEAVPNQSLLGVIDEHGIYIGEYLIPIEWWNSHVSGSLTRDQIHWIRDHFKID
jgi:hypothetical protein